MAMTESRTDGSGTAEQPHAQEGTSPIGTLAEVLGWASLGLGVPQVTTPGRFVRVIGVRPDGKSRAWTLVVGVRELAAAAGILQLGKPRPTGWLWARVAGDVMDLALLGSALGSKAEKPGRTMAAIGAVVGVGVADVVAALGMSGKEGAAADEDGAMHLRAATTVRQSREDVYRFWHDFQNLPRFMAHLESVRVTGDRRTHWKATGPVGRTVEWDAETVEDRPNELIAWRSVDGSSVKHSGTVRFVPAPGDRGTEIHLDMHYETPGGPIGATVAKLFGEEPEQQVKDDLRRFKQVAETGTIVRSEGSPEGPLARRLMRQRPAQPPPDPVGAGPHGHSH
ncbi:MAG: hypothetical protein QOD55_2329 [Solirubrobacteraceae bacterium]|jgi:uncharacterized membrane protein|nr:hypothetical protein [Solirubrobacteraceae bacterium]